MSSVDQKLDLLINSITKIEKKLDGFGERINKLQEIYKNQENRIEERFQRLNDYFEGKVKILSNRISINQSINQHTFICGKKNKNT